MTPASSSPALSAALLLVSIVLATADGLSWSTINCASVSRSQLESLLLDTTTSAWEVRADDSSTHVLPIPDSIIPGRELVTLCRELRALHSIPSFVPSVVAQASNGSSISRVLSGIEIGIEAAEGSRDLLSTAKHLFDPSKQQQFRDVRRPLLLSLLVEAAQALHALHISGLMHGDVAPHSFSVDQDSKHLQMIGFSNSLSKFETSELTLDQPMVGSVAYMAPEVIAHSGVPVSRYLPKTHSHRIGRKSDIYSFGLLMSVVCGATETLKDDEVELEWFKTRSRLKHDREIVRDSRLSFRPRCNSDLMPFINMCLKEHPKERPTAAELVEYLESLLLIENLRPHQHLY